MPSISKHGSKKHSQDDTVKPEAASSLIAEEQDDKELNPSPSPEQRVAAEAMLAQALDEQKNGGPSTPSSTARATSPSTPPSTSAGARTVQSAGLRAELRDPVQEANTEDAPAARPNAVELRGLRSPALPTKLPMDI